MSRVAPARRYLLARFQTLRRSEQVRARAAVVCIFAGLVLLTASAIHFRPTGIVEWPVSWSPGDGLVFNADPRPVPDYGTELGLPLLLLVTGLGCTVGALRLTPRRLPGLHPPSHTLPSIRPGWLALIAGTLGLLVLAEANGRLLNSGGWLHLPGWVQVGLLAGGSVLAAWGLAGATFAPNFWRSAAAWLRTPEAGGLLLLTGGALLVRIWQLGHLLPQPVDEMNFMLATRQIGAAEHPALLEPVTGVIGMTRVFPYFQAEAVAALGRNLTALRLPSAIIGALTVPAVYALARALYDARTGWAAAGLLAAFPPHVHYSRIGLNNIADPLFGTLALALLAWGLRHQRPVYVALGGACLGLSQYFYEGGRWLLPLLVVAWLAYGWLAWERTVTRRAVVLLIAGCALAALPFYTVLHARGFPASARYDAVGYRQAEWDTVLRDPAARHNFAEHVRDAFLIYHHTPEAARFYGGQTPLLLIAMAPLALAGLGACLARPRDPGSSLLVLWVVATALGSSTLTGYPTTTRYVVVLPVLAVLAALGLRLVLLILADERPLPRLHVGLGLGIARHGLRLRLGSRADGLFLVGSGISRWGNHNRRARLRGRLTLDLGTALLAIILAGTAWWHLAYYTGPHIDLLNQQLRYLRVTRDGADAVLRAAELPPGTVIHFISDPPYDERYAQDLLAFFADDMPVRSITPSALTDDYLAALPRDVNYAFFIAPDDAATLQLVSQYFVFGAPRVTRYAIPLEKQYVLYFAPRQ